LAQRGRQPLQRLPAGYLKPPVPPTPETEMDQVYAYTSKPKFKRVIRGNLREAEAPNETAKSK